MKEGNNQRGGWQFHLGPLSPSVTIGVFRHFCQKRNRAVATSLEWLQTSSNCPRRQLISANQISMITSSGGCTRSWKTFKHRAFQTYHKVKPAINLQISRNLGDVDNKSLQELILMILTLVHTQHQLSTLKASVHLSAEWSIHAATPCCYLWILGYILLFCIRQCLREILSTTSSSSYITFVTLVQYICQVYLMRNIFLKI